MKDKNILAIALDIDDFLTTMETRELKKRDWLDPVHHSKKHFLNVKFKHEGREYHVENLLVPGCIELFCFLFNHKNVRPAFFSSGVRDRNVELGRTIVHQAVDLAGDSSWLDRYDVYSREDCFDTEGLRHHNHGIQDKFQPEDHFGNYKKDLRMIYYGREKYQELLQKTLYENPSILLPNPEKDAEMLKNIVMVEEDSSYLFPGQEKNMLLCPTFFSQPYPYGINYDQDDLPPENKERFVDDFKKHNTLFYAAGVLERVFKRHDSEGISIPELLWEEQGTLWIDGDRYDERYPKHFFEEGRAVLRQYNSELNFLVPCQEKPETPTFSRG